MEQLYVINRLTGAQEEELVYGEGLIRFLYGNRWLSRSAGCLMMHVLSRVPFFSSAFGYIQRLPSSKKKILPFITRYGINSSDFLISPKDYQSFDDFFTRKLKPESRPIAPGKNVAVIPADGRYRFFPDLDKVNGFIVKGERFTLLELLEDAKLAEEYSAGTMVMARLCPTDYHRYHFPCDCIPGTTRFINGWLYSVNPMAVRRDIRIFTQNKRTLCELESEAFGKVLFLEIGATSVGSIHETYVPGRFYEKGEEKGFFSFGGSSLILLFKPNTIQLSSDLLDLSQFGLEIRCLMGQCMGTGTTSPSS